MTVICYFAPLQTCKILEEVTGSIVRLETEVSSKISVKI